jgi:hypothetical protein
LAPWFITGAEARFLVHALEQTVAVAPRFRENLHLLEPEDEDEYLVRVPKKVKGNLTWRDEIQKIPAPAPKSFRLPMDKAALAHLEQVPQTMADVDVDFFWMPTPVGERGTRPYFPYTLLLLEPSTGMILGASTSVADPSAAEMWASVPMRLVQTLANINLKPKTIRVISPALETFLKPLSERLEMDLKLLPELPQLENAKDSLIGYISF